MDTINLRNLTSIIGGTPQNIDADQIVESITIDSRRVGSNAVFFALPGEKTDGHQHICNAFENGAVAVVVNTAQLPENNSFDQLIAVPDTLAALQDLAAWWRAQITGKVVAITGSNGKTIIKDSLVQILQSRYSAAGSLGSYNSQLGVALSMLRIPREIDYAVIEVGVSERGEMERLEKLVRPDFGILTNIGMAHMASFGSRDIIAEEKMKLFKNIPSEGWLLAPKDCDLIEPLLDSLNCQVVRFPASQLSCLPAQLLSPEIAADLQISAHAASLLGVSGDEITTALSTHEPANTRSEIWRSPIGITLINDSCSSDPISVQSALRTLAQVKGEKDRGIFVFGGMCELGESEQEEHKQIGEMAAGLGVDTLVLVGGVELDATADSFLAAHQAGSVLRFQDIEELSQQLPSSIRPGDTILFKGSRGTGIDRVAREITYAMAYNRFIVDVQSLSENISRFRRLTGPNVKILGMVKAMAYGSDLIRLSRELQQLRLDVLGVSTPDEGMLLRRSGIDLPILVTLCTKDEVEKIGSIN